MKHPQKYHKQIGVKDTSVFLAFVLGISRKYNRVEALPITFGDNVIMVTVDNRQK